MIEPEIITINGKQYKKYISPNGLPIKKVGTEEIYEEAIDNMDADYQYIEIEREEDLNEE